MSSSLKCPACGAETTDALPHHNLAALFRVGRELGDLHRCPKCDRLVDPSSETGFVSYVEVKRRFRANLRWHQYTDNTIDDFIQEIERKENSEFRRMLLLRYSMDRRMRRSPRARSTRNYNSGTIRVPSTGMLGFDGLMMTGAAVGTAVGQVAGLATVGIATHALAQLRAVPLFGPLSPKEEELTEKRLMLSWEKKFLGLKKQELMACVKCGARVRPQQNKFCEECGANL